MAGKVLYFYVWGLTRRWMCRGNPNKSKDFMVKKYFSLQKVPELCYRDKWTFRDEKSKR